LSSIKALEARHGEGLRMLCAARIDDMDYSDRPFCARTLNASAALADPLATRRAFALVSLSHPRLSYEGWVRFLRRATRSKRGTSGMIFIEDPRGYPHALFRYAVSVDSSLVAAEDGLVRVLRLTDLVVAEIAGSGLLSTIAQSGEELAQALGCNSVVIELPGALRAKVTELADYQSVAAGVICKALRPDSGRRQAFAGQDPTPPDLQAIPRH
jgi:hypothetical protein